MKKIAIICDSLARGGAERNCIYLAKYFVSKGHKVTIVTAYKNKEEYELPEGIERVILLPPGKRYNSIVKILKLNLKLSNVLKTNKADAAVIMGTPMCLYSAIPCFLKRVRFIVSERNDPNSFDGKKSTKIISRLLMRLANAFVFQTKDAKAFYSKALKNRGEVIPNPLLHPNLPQEYEGEREKVLVSAGRLVEQKNQALLIDAFSEIYKDYPEYKLIIYGEGPLRERLEAQIEKLGLSESVLLPGNYEDVLERMKKAAMFVFPSNFEGMPNALIEAMAIGLPCISTDCPCGGPRELIQNHKNGILVPVKDYEGLVNAIRELLNDSESAAKIGHEAVSIREKLEPERIGAAWLKIIEEM